MIRELDIVEITQDKDEHGLRRGDAGTVVHSYSDGAAFEVEFVTAEGKTIALSILTNEDIRLLGKRGTELVHIKLPKTSRT